MILEAEGGLSSCIWIGGGGGGRRVGRAGTCPFDDGVGVCAPSRLMSDGRGVRGESADANTDGFRETPCPAM